MKAIKVISAYYASKYKLNILFNDNTWKTVDFEPFLFTHDKGYYNKYRTLTNFKKFKIEDNNIVWGENWDLIFHVQHLYKGTISIKEPLSDTVDFSKILENAKKTKHVSILGNC